MYAGYCLAVADTPIPGAVSWALACAGGALAAGSAMRLWSGTRAPREVRRQRLLSLGTWWVLYSLLVLAVLGGPRAVVVLLAVLSLWGLYEYARLTRRQAGARWIWPATIALAVAHYGALYFGRADLAQIGTPLSALVLLLIQGISAGRTDGFLRATALPLLGLILIVYCPSHAVMSPGDSLAASDRLADTSLLVYLVLLTELHDIAQALWGRACGRQKITPKISPGKTWEGFVLGSATTICLAVLLMPLLAPMGQARQSGGHGSAGSMVLIAGLGGLVIAVSGFLGDISMSAIKRDCGVKDSGTILPGQGGILDRIDSLTLSAPAFYYYTLAVTRFAGQ